MSHESSFRLPEQEWPDTLLISIGSVVVISALIDHLLGAFAVDPEWEQPPPHQKMVNGELHLVWERHPAAGAKLPDGERLIKLIKKWYPDNPKVKSVLDEYSALRLFRNDIHHAGLILKSSRHDSGEQVFVTSRARDSSEPKGSHVYRLHEFEKWVIRARTLLGRVISLQDEVLR